MNTLDQRVDQAIGPGYRYIRKYFTVFSATLLSVIVVFVMFKMFYTKPYFVASVMHNDMNRIERILHNIDKTCEILGTQGGSAAIDFLTIKTFTGSMVGGVDLAHPKNWRGPYLEQNPTMQGRFYELAKAKDGYFIIPGKNVMLPNGVVIGRDLIVSAKNSLEKHTKIGGFLNYKGIKLAVKASFKIGDWHRKAPSEETLDKINDTIEQFNEALPFTLNKAPEQTLV